MQWLVAALGVGLGFGLQEIVANFVSGLILLAERPVRIGDVVTVGDVSGTVARIRARATTVIDFEQQGSDHPEQGLHHRQRGQLDALGPDHAAADLGRRGLRERYRTGAGGCCWRWWTAIPRCCGIRRPRCSWCLRWARALINFEIRAFVDFARQAVASAARARHRGGPGVARERASRCRSRSNSNLNDPASAPEPPN